MLDDLGKPARAESYSFQIAGSNLAGLSGVPIHVDSLCWAKSAMSLGMAGFRTSQAQLMSSTGTKGLDPLERYADVRAQYFVLRDKVEAGEVPP